MERGEWEARRASVVAVQVHGVLEAGGGVDFRYQDCGVGDAALPVYSGFFFAGAEGFPDGDRRVGRGAGECEGCSAGSGAQGFPDLSFGSGEQGEIFARERADFLDALHGSSGFEHAGDVGMRGQLGDRRGGEIDTGDDRSVVDNDGDG